MTPVLCKKILPGDRWRVSISSITRLAPLANPVYDRVRITFDAFFVQNRIIDPDWKDYVSPDPEKSDNPKTDIIQYMESASDETIDRFFRRGGLMDYLGFQASHYGKDGKFPVSSSGTIRMKINGAPLLGYLKIWDNWYRNERFQASCYNAIMTSYSKSSRTFCFSINDSGFPDYFDSEFGFLPVNYGKDLYTTALAEPMIGGPVNIPSGAGAAEVKYQDSLGNPADPINATRDSSSHDLTLDVPSATGAAGKLVADMKTAVLGTIQELKFAYALFSFFMKDTYNGNRYVEFMQAHYGVTVPDSTLERSLFLGRVTQWINFTEIFQTSGSTAETNSLGDYAGIGAATGSGFLFDYNFLEHGYLYILMSIRPNATYFQGVDRKFFYGDRFDSLYFPEFQNVGDKPIYTAEIYNDLVESSYPDFSWTEINASDIFGYNRANAEYIWFHDEMHGNFLNENSEFNWTFARRFGSKPVLGNVFSRVHAVNNPFTYQGEDSLNYYTDILFNISALRPVVRYEHY